MAVPDGIEIREGETTVELQGGQWAIIRDPHLVPEGRRRPLIDLAATSEATRTELKALSDQYQEEVDRVAAELGIDAGLVTADQMDSSRVPSPTQTVLDTMANSVDLLILALVRQWSYGPKINLETLVGDEDHDGVPGPDYDTLRDTVAPMYRTVMPDLGPRGAVVVREDGTKELSPDSPT